MVVSNVAALVGKQCHSRNNGRGRSMSKEYEYHTKQFKETKRGTVFFIDWLASRVFFDGKQILDMACGGGT